MTWEELESDLLGDIELYKLDERPNLKEMFKLVVMAGIAHDKAKDEQA